MGHAGCGPSFRPIPHPVSPIPPPAPRYLRPMPSARRLVPLARALARPGGVGAALRWKPFSITAFEMAGALRASGLRPEVVIDGGANAGQFARAMAETFPEARVIAFEPLPEVAQTFRERLGSEPRVRLVQSALGAEPGRLTFYRNPYSLASSALPVAEDGPLVQPHEEALEVPVTTLDDALADDDLPASTLLKLDLQGYELEALRGGPETLGRVGHVLLEVALRPSYEGEPTFEALLDHLRPFGFRFLRPVDVLRDEAGTIVQMDALFGRDA